MEGPFDDLNSNLYILHSNQLTGLVPTFTKYVVHLDYSSNRFSTAPLGMDKYIHLSYNSFNDFIHVCLMERNSTLRVLNLTGNKLKGYLSDTTSSSCNSRFLNLNGNLLSGIIPNSLANKSYILETISLVIDFEVKHFHCMCWFWGQTNSMVPLHVLITLAVGRCYILSI